MELLKSLQSKPTGRHLAVLLHRSCIREFGTYHCHKDFPQQLDFFLSDENVFSLLQVMPELDIPVLLSLPRSIVV